MKKLIACPSLLVALTLPVLAQETPEESRLAHNRDVCASVSLPANCTDAQIAIAKPGTRSIDQTVYATLTAYRDAVLIVPKVAERFKLRQNRAYELLMQRVQGARCVAIMTAAELPVDVCK